MEWSTLELNIISCCGIKSFNLFKKPSVYAVVSIINGELKKKQQRPNCLQRQKTPVDREGGRNPEWNHVMNFDIKAVVNKCRHLFLSYDLYCEGVIYGNNSIGRVRVPLKDLVDEFNEASSARFVRYQVRTRDGKPNGVLLFSYKLKETTTSKKAKSPEAEFQFYGEKVKYPYIEIDEQSSPGICYPSLDYANNPLPGFYSPPSNYKYKATEVYNYNTALPPLSPPQVYHHPRMPSPGPWYTVESTGYNYGYDFRRC